MNIASMLTMLKKQVHGLERVVNGLFIDVIYTFHNALWL